MAAIAAGRSRPLARLFMGPRVGATMLALGLVFSTAAAILVISLDRRARAAGAATAARAQQVPVAYVVMTTRDVAESSRIPADALAVKPFPAAYAPPGAAKTVEEVAGMFATTRLARDQIVLASEVSAVQRGTNVAASIPPGKVAYWMPVPDLLTQTGGLRPGDRIDILLSLTLPAAPGQPGQPAAPADQARGVTTQTTLQNVEVFLVGTASEAGTAGAAGAAPVGGAGGATARAGQAASPNVALPGTKVAVVVLEPQDAVVAKFIKDSGGTVDVVLRSRESQDAVTTDPVSIDNFAQRFRFRGQTAATPGSASPGAGGGR